MSKPTKGNKTKRPASDERRLKNSHINFLKRDKAIVYSDFNVPEGFKVNKFSKNRIRIKGPGALAIKLALPKDRAEVIKAVADRNWTRVASLIPMETKVIDYKKEEVTVR